MEIIIFFSWILISLIIPIALLVVGFTSYLNGQNLWKTVSRSFFAFVGYAMAATVTLGIVGGMFNAAIHEEPDHKVLDLTGQIIFVVLLLIYSAVGWLLCSFISGKIVKPWRVFRLNKEQPQSIFDSK